MVPAIGGLDGVWWGALAFHAARLRGVMDDAGGLCDVHEPNYARGRDRRSLALPPGEGAGVVGVPLTRRARRLMRLPLAPGLFVIERPIRERSLFRRVTFCVWMPVRKKSEKKGFVP